jgi:hypothetical protein
MAVPGDTQCHEVAPCGTGDYGTIPVDATTQFVNGAYPGNDSDGTQAKPWKTINDGVANATKPGTIVAVAAGTYNENVLIHQRPVRLWGRCPTMVEVVGTAANAATLAVEFGNASASEIHGLAITGLSIGIWARGSSGVVVDRVWVHDTMSVGLEVDIDGPTSVTVSASLFETTTEAGVLIVGSQATIESTVVRDTQPLADGTFGRGIEVDDDAKGRAGVILRASLLMQNHEDGVLVTGSDATIEATVVRDTQPNGSVDEGNGILAEADLVTHERARMTLRTSLLEQNYAGGVKVLGSDATIEASVVRATQPSSDGAADSVLAVGIGGDTGRATLTLRSSLVDQNHDVGVTVQCSDATIESTVVRDTQPRSDGREGFGVVAQDYGVMISGAPAAHGRAKLGLSASIVEKNHDVGVHVMGSDATIESTVVRDTQPNSDGTRGQGIQVEGDSPMQRRATLLLRATLLERNHDTGVLVLGSDATIEKTEISATSPTSHGEFGDGIAVELGTATITSTHVESSARSGVSNFSSSVVLVSSAVQCNAFDLDGEVDPNAPPFSFDGSMGNVCGCGNAPDPTCPVVSANLSAPSGIPPIKQ